MHGSMHLHFADARQDTACADLCMPVNYIFTSHTGAHGQLTNARMLIWRVDAETCVLQVMHAARAEANWLVACMAAQLWDTTHRTHDRRNIRVDCMVRLRQHSNDACAVLNVMGECRIDKTRISTVSKKLPHGALHLCKQILKFSGFLPTPISRN